MIYSYVESWYGIKVSGSVVGFKLNPPSVFLFI